MITKFKIFENKETASYVNSVSPEFWKMIEIADWKSFIINSNLEWNSPPSFRANNEEQKKPYEVSLKECKARVYLKYEYQQILKFLNEYHKMYMQLYDYFYEYNNKIRATGDDGYTDLIGSIIGLGKDFVQKINKTQFSKMAKDNFYAQGFQEILEVDEDEYVEIRTEVDPVWGAAKKYNI